MDSKIISKINNNFDNVKQKEILISNRLKILLFGLYILICTGCGHTYSYSVIRLETSHEARLMMTDLVGKKYDLKGGRNHIVPDMDYKEFSITEGGTNIDNNSILINDINDMNNRIAVSHNINLPSACKIKLYSVKVQQFPVSESDLETLKKTSWWSEKQNFNDAEVLSKKINWDNFNEDDIKIGAFLHYGHKYSFRNSNWVKSAGTEKNATHPCYKHIFVSIVPFIEYKGSTMHVLVPKLKVYGSKFTEFNFAEHDKIKYETFVRDYPHYYPTMEIRLPCGKTSSAIEYLQGIEDVESYKLTKPVQVHSETFKKLRTIGDLLKKVFEREEFLFLRESFKIFKPGTELQLLPLGFSSPNYRYKYIVKPPHRISGKIKLPPDFVQALENSGRKLSENLQIEGCIIEKKLLSQNDEFKISCNEQKQYKVSMSGFKEFQKPMPEPFNLTIEEKDLITQISIKTGDESFWFDGGKLAPQTQKVIEVPYKEIVAKELRLRKNKEKESNDDFIKAVSLESILAKEIIKVRTGAEVTFTWPYSWGDLKKITGYKKKKYLENKEKETYQLQCTVEKGSTISLSWGKGWGPVKIDIKQEETIISLDKYFQPPWPFDTKDTWWKTDTLNIEHKNTDPCSAGPQYILDRVEYVSRASEEHAPYQKNIEWDTIGVLPTLVEMKWDISWPLPDSIYFHLKQYEHNALSYKYKPSVIVMIQDIPKSLFTLKGNFFDVLKADEIPVRAPESPMVGYSTDISVHLFDSLDSCQTGENRTGLYMPVELNNLKVNACSFAKLIQENEAVTKCVQAKFTDKKDAVMFEFIPVKCLNKRKLFLISLSEGLSEIKAHRIKEHLFKRFCQIKDNNIKTPFNLFFIGSGRTLQPILSCEDIQSLDKEGTDDSISKRLSFINFNANDLRAIDDLNLVDNEFHGKLNNLSEVLYLTDNAHMLFPDDDVPGDQIGTPLKWYHNNISFKVLTVGSCDIWKKNAKAKCVECQNLDQVKNEIDNFLGTRE